VFTKARRWTLYCVRSIQSTHSHAFLLSSILILSSHVRLGLPRDSSLYVFRQVSYDITVPYFTLNIPHAFKIRIQNFIAVNTGQFKKKVTLSHVYNEVTSEPTVTRYASIVRKALKVLICPLTNTQCGNPVSHGTRQSGSSFLSRLSPACPCLWLPQWR
jgi:hypothetical protein